MYGTSEAFGKNRIFEAFFKVIFVVCIVGATMGEWRVITNVYGGLPKVVCVGVIFTACAYAFIKPDAKRLKEVAVPTLVYMSLIVFLMLWSLVIWIMKFADVASVVRGSSKMLYQTICIFTAVSAVYLFGGEAVDIFAASICIGNGIIMLIEIPNYGLSESINSLINCVVKFGDAVGYARALEIHDLTFVFGQLIIYYAAFAPKETYGEKKRRVKYLILCTFFFLVGMKRIAIPAVILFLVFSFILRNKKNLTKFFVICGICVFAFFILFIYGVKTGWVSKILVSMGIDMMGRDYMWFLAGGYYDVSPLYMGRGFEFVDTVVKQWYNEGLLKAALMFHNDILKVFVEMGFFGFSVWALLQYVVYPIFFVKYADTKTATLYFMELGYMTITYLTDNTAFYFWSTMGLKLIVLAYGFYRKTTFKEEKERWTPPTKEQVRELMASKLDE